MQIPFTPYSFNLLLFTLSILFKYFLTGTSLTYLSFLDISPLPSLSNENSSSFMVSS